MKSSEERPDHKSKEGDEVDWEELRNFVVDQIKRAGRNISRHIAESDKAKIKAYVKTRGGNFESWYDRLEKSGVLESDLQGDGRSANRRPASRVPANRGREQESGPFSVFRRFREKVTRKARSTATALRVHLVVYAGVNLLLLMLWGMTGAGFPWFLIPAAGWGIGIANHAQILRQRLHARREINELPDLSDDETELVEASFSERASLGSHGASTLSISFFLFVIYAITGGGFPWYLIPAGGLAFSYLIHLASRGPELASMRRQIRSWMGGARRQHLSDGAESNISGIDAPVVQEAEAIRRNIVKQAASARSDGIDMGSDLEQLLDTYVDQIRKLSRKHDEMGQITGTLDSTTLQRDRQELIERRGRTSAESVKSEYEKSIAEIDQQIASIRDIEASRELIELRLRSAMNLMKQLQLDLARAKGVSLTNDAPFALLRDKSEELSGYLTDLESGYAEIDS